MMNYISHEPVFSCFVVGRAPLPNGANVSSPGKNHSAVRNKAFIPNLGPSLQSFRIILEGSCTSELKPSTNHWHLETEHNFLEPFQETETQCTYIYE